MPIPVDFLTFGFKDNPRDRIFCLHRLRLTEVFPQTPANSCFPPRKWKKKLQNLQYPLRIRCIVCITQKQIKIRPSSISNRRGPPTLEILLLSLHYIAISIVLHISTWHFLPLFVLDFSKLFLFFSVGIFYP